MTDQYKDDDMHTMVERTDALFIGGRWAQPSTAATIEVVSPATEEPIATVAAASERDVDAAVAAARHAFDHGPWPRLTPAERIDRLRGLADHYLANYEEMGQLVSREVGTPIAFSRLGQAWAPWSLLDATLRFAGDHPWEEVRPTTLGIPATVRHAPVGVVAAIAPWNVPQMTIMSKLAPALVAGCTIVVKPSPEAPLDALLLAEWLRACDLPEGVVSILPAGREVGEHLVRHPGIDKVAFTGSTEAGRRIGAICGEQVKRCSLELGGKSAAIVLPDADLDVMAAGLRFASFINSGQACVLQSRVLAPRSRYADVVDALVGAAGSFVVGDPLDEATEVGPLVSRRQHERVSGYVDIGLAEGARLALGGPGRPEGLDRGWYVRPTVFVDVTNDMRIAREEIFGPVVGVIAYDDEDEAVSIANDSPYGLAGSVWTADEEHGIDVARRVRAGTIGINKYAPDFSAPFGGFKQSGIGREYGPESLHEYVELQSIS